MNTRIRTTSVAAIVAGMSIAIGGCTDSSQTVGQKVDRAADKVATTTERAADKIASATDRATANAAANIDDAALTAKVKAAVFAEPGLKSLQIDVDTKDAVVTLGGTVDSPAMKERATQVAQGVGGVRNVVDKLVVKSS